MGPYYRQNGSYYFCRLSTTDLVHLDVQCFNYDLITYQARYGFPYTKYKILLDPYTLKSFKHVLLKPDYSQDLLDLLVRYSYPKKSSSPT